MNPRNRLLFTHWTFADLPWRRPGRSRRVLFLSIVLLGLPIGCCQRHQHPFLYNAGPKEFIQRGPIEVYSRDTLFDYMDGEAEVYLPLGFTLLYTARYRKPGTDAVILSEVYDMGSPSGARGVFDVYTRKGGTEVEGIGDAAWTDQAIILFWRNKHFFRVRPDPTAETGAPASLNDLILVSRSMDQVAAKTHRP